MTKLVILGSGTAVSSFYHSFDFRYPSGYLLQHDNKNYLIDCSEGVRERLERLKIDYDSINTIFISHFHPDHFNLQTLIQSFQVRNFPSGKISKIKVFGPPGIEERFKTIWETTHFKGNYENILPKHVSLKFIEYKDGEKIVLDDFFVTPYQVIHGNMPAFALRFEIKNKFFVYSGDSGLCQGVKNASRQADVFICESNELLGSINPSHLNSVQAAEIAKENDVKTLVLTHLLGGNSNKEISLAVKTTGFKGKLQIAKDFDVLQL